MSSTKTFADNVSKVLEKLGWSRAELARRLNMTPGNVNRILSMANSPNLETIDKFAAVLGVTAHELITDESNPNAIPTFVPEVTYEDALDYLKDAYRTDMGEMFTKIDDLEREVYRLLEHAGLFDPNPPD